MPGQEYKDSGWYAAFLREQEYESQRRKRNSETAAGSAATANEVTIEVPAEEEMAADDLFSESDQQ